MTHPLRATLQWLCRMAEWVAIVALIAATALIMAQIVAREIFVAGLSWADELARYAGLTVIFMAVPAAARPRRARQGRHVPEHDAAAHAPLRQHRE